MTVPYAFGAATSAIPLSQLDSNFNTPITLGNTAIQLGNTVTTLNNMTLANVTITSGSVTITSGNVTVTNANVTSALTLSGLTASTALALDASKNVVSVTNTGTGNNVLSASPTLTGTVNAASVTLSSDFTLSAGTANGVAYLNGSKVLTTGSALTFDGTNFRNTSGAFEGVDNMTLTALVSGTNSTVLTLNSAGTNGTTRFQINGSEQMRLTSTGLGIGTSSPSGKLHVAGQTRIQDSANAANYILIGSGANATRGGNSVMAQTSSMVMGTEGAAPLIFITNAAEAARIDSSGNLLAGLTSPLYGTSNRVQISANGTSTAIMSVSHGGLASQSGYMFWDGTNLQVANNSSSGALIFGTNSATERARITSAGSFVAGGSVALATTATDGFLYVPTCAGTPTGTPTAITGMAPIVVNTTNNKLYFYSGGAWRDAGP